MLPPLLNGVVRCVPPTSATPGNFEPLTARPHTTGPVTPATAPPEVAPVTGGPSRQHRAASAPGPPLLAVSPPPSTPPARTAGPWPLPNAPECCAQVRGNVRETLTLWGLADLIPQAELLANELAANAVRHGRDPIRLTLALDDDGTLRCLVDDGSVLLPRPRRAAEEDEGGRGLALVALLASRWGAERSPNGKTVWYELGPGSR